MFVSLHVLVPDRRYVESGENERFLTEASNSIVWNKLAEAMLFLVHEREHTAHVTIRLSRITCSSERDIGQRGNYQQNL